MNQSARHVVMKALVCLFLLALCAPDAAAFFPFGGTTTATSDIRFIRWPLDVMDTNHDGDIRDVGGVEEGIIITFEGGPLGFTDDEMLELERAFDVWEKVPSAYPAFRFTEPITDALQLISVGQEDGINFVTLEVAGDAVGSLVAFPVLAVTIVNTIIEDTTRTTPDGTVYPITGGRIIEVDMAFGSASFRSIDPTVPPIADLFGVAVHEIGHLLGLGHTPMNTLEVDLDTGELFERADYSQRDGFNQLNQVGLTPTLFPFTFSTRGGPQPVGAADLAPDDIAGLSFLYPRGGVSPFFTIAHKARTQSGSSVPSTPLLGGFVTAWCDVDNDPSTPRLPFASTITGFYEPFNLIQERGNFELHGLNKVIEAVGRGAFQASYTLTLDPVVLLRFPLLQAGDGPATFDTSHTYEPGDAWTVPYDLFFPSEVFHENREFFGSENFDDGTPLVYNAASALVLSVESGKSLDQILVGDIPMFGDQNEVCPLNLLTQDFAVAMGPRLLRGFRDGVLMKTAVGVAFVDAYYEMSPAMVAFLMEHRICFVTLRSLALGVEWVLANPVLVLGAVLMMGVFGFAYRRRRKASVLAGLVGVLAVGLFAGSAYGASVAVTELELTALADDIVQGTVTDVESTLASPYPKVETTVTIDIEDTLKGRLNKNTSIYLDLPIGHVGAYTAYSNEIAQFKEGEEVVLFLKYRPTAGFIVLGGPRGKHVIGFDPDVAAPDEGDAEGEGAAKDADEDVGKYLIGVRPSSLASLKAQATWLGSGDDQETGFISLPDYKDFIRETVRRQKAEGN